jgi:hypothetical protein
MATTVTTGTLPLALAETFSNSPVKVYIYLEYANNANDIPTSFNTAGNITNFDNPLAYYSGLAANSRNFLRVPAIRNPTITNIVDATSGQTTTTYIAQTAPDSVKVLSAGPTFGNTSICYGAALVLAKNDADYTQDIVMARSYFTASTERLTKSSASELFITFPLTINSTKAT